jgi:hypothetical protein
MRPAPTVEALVGLVGAGTEADVVDGAVGYLVAIAERLASGAQPTDSGVRNDAAIAVWGLSELGGPWAQATREVLVAAFHELAVRPEMFRHDLWYDRFNNPHAGGSDYFSYNLTLLLLTAGLNLLCSGIIPTTYSALLGPHVARVAHTVADHRYFPRQGAVGRPGAQAAVYFWEHYQAVTAIHRLRTACDLDPRLGGASHMDIHPVHFTTTHFVTDPKLMVVLMPFSTDWSGDVYEVFERVGKAKGYTVWRSDDTFTDDAIMQTIWEHINSARLVVADCTGRNPNVFYELGLAHTVGKPVFICAQRRKDIPFDIVHIRSFTYRPTGLKNLASDLGKFIDSL